MSAESPWMTTNEAAEYARVHRETIHGALQSGDLEGHQINGKPSNPWLTTTAALDAWIRGEKPHRHRRPSANEIGHEETSPGTRISDEPKLLLNAPEAAELLGVGETTIRELWGAGHLRFVRIGKGRKVTRHELERFIADREEFG